MKLLPDTNVLVYDTVEDAEMHEEAKKIIDEARHIFLPSIIIHEYIWVMLRLVKAGPNFTALKIQEYLDDPRTRYLLEPPRVLAKALEMLQEDGGSVKEINDYIILATALTYNLTLATFDKKLRKIARHKGAEIAPLP